MGQQRSVYAGMPGTRLLANQTLTISLMIEAFQGLAITVVSPIKAFAYRCDLRQIKNVSEKVSSVSVWRVVKGPGPGAYKEISTRADGMYPLSTFGRTKSPQWRPKINPDATKYERVPYTGKLPGPGFYDLSSILMS